MGKAVGGSPWITILISLIVCGACLAGLVNFTQESRGDKLWTPGDSTAQKHKNWVDDNFPLESRVSIALLVTDDVLTPSTLKTVKTVINLILKLLQTQKNAGFLDRSRFLLFFFLF